jgi:uncharacterized surface protein with fasciclin (FAS1) repeats
MVSENLTRSTALGGLVIAGALVLGACQSTRESGEAQTATASETTEVAAAVADDATEATETAVASGDIVATVAAQSQLSTLGNLIEAAGLADTLRGAGPYTLFAPTDAAFAALPAGTVDALLLPQNRSRLAQILSYHVVSGSALGSADIAGQSLTLGTLEGRDLRIRDGKVNNATVIGSDIDAANGVIHVIDTVLIP